MNSSLIVLDRAIPGGPDPYGLLRHNQWTRDIFSFIAYVTDLECALILVRLEKDTVMVVGSTFLTIYAEGKEKLRSVFLEAGLSDDRLIFASSAFGCECRGQYVQDMLYNVVFRASGHPIAQM